MQGCASGPPTSGASGGPSHFPLALGALFLAGGDVWQLASLIQVCSGKKDRNAPLGEDLVFLGSMPACSTAPVPGFLSVPAPPLTSVFPILHLLFFFLCTFLC